MFYFDVLQHESDQSIINLFHKLSSSHVHVILASIFLINFVNLIWYEPIKPVNKKEKMGSFKTEHKKHFSYLHRHGSWNPSRNVNMIEGYGCGTIGRVVASDNRKTREL